MCYEYPNKAARVPKSCRGSENNAVKQHQRNASPGFDCHSEERRKDQLKIWLFAQKHRISRLRCTGKIIPHLVLFRASRENRSQFPEERREQKMPKTREAGGNRTRRLCNEESPRSGTNEPRLPDNAPVYTFGSITRQRASTVLDSGTAMSRDVDEGYATVESSQSSERSLSNGTLGDYGWREKGWSSHPQRLSTTIDVHGPA